MEKFLSVPEVAAGGNEQLVSISDIKLVTQARRNTSRHTLWTRQNSKTNLA